MEKNKTTIFNKLYVAALEQQDFFKNNNWYFCFIGGLAVQRWGEIRNTKDIDLCLLCGFGNESDYITTLLNHFSSRVKNAEKFALKNRILLLFASNGVQVDISLSGILYEEEMISRATYFDYLPGCSLLTCSAEDLIILKAFADRGQDWVDIEHIIKRQNTNLDKNYIKDRLYSLCEPLDYYDIPVRLENMFSP